MSERRVSEREGPKRKRRFGVIGALVGVAAAAGIAAGVATERYLVRRSKRGDDVYADEPFGELPFTSQLRVLGDDGVELHVEVIDGPGSAAGDSAVGDSAVGDVTLIFVHGFCLDMGTFHFQRQALQGRYRMVL